MKEIKQKTLCKQAGFNLIEISISLLIVGLLLSGSMAAIATLDGYKKRQQDQNQLQQIKASLLNFALINQRFPCPDSDGDGQENRINGFCAASYGNLPFSELSVPKENPYGVAYSYQINRKASSNQALDPDSAASYFGQCEQNCFKLITPPSKQNPTDAGNFTIKNQQQNLAIEIPLLVISHGKNPCELAQGLEKENCKTNQQVFYQALPIGANADFDDLLIWISSLEIKSPANQILLAID